MPATQKLDAQAIILVLLAMQVNPVQHLDHCMMFNVFLTVHKLNVNCLKWCTMVHNVSYIFRHLRGAQCPWCLYGTYRPRRLAGFFFSSRHRKASDLKSCSEVSFLVSGLNSVVPVTSVASLSVQHQSLQFVCTGSHTCRAHVCSLRSWVLQGIWPMSAMQLNFTCWQCHYYAGE